MLYTGYTDEKKLGCDDEEKCLELHLRKKDDIEFVKRHMMPYTQGVEEARYNVQEAMKDEIATQNHVGDELDPEQEKEIEECQEAEEVFHPDFIQVNPDDLEFAKNLTQVKKTLRSIELKSADEILKDANTCSYRF